MSQPQQQMMGGPVGAPQQQQQMLNAGTPNSGSGALDPVKRLNTVIYDYLLRNQLYDTARSFVDKMEIEMDTKKSPSQRQANGGGDDDGMDADKNRPSDLPVPAQFGDGPFLQDWWCQFWDIFQGNRGKGRPSTLNYIGAQRQAQKARTNMMGGGNMDAASMQNMRGYNNIMQVNNGMGMPNDLKRAAMQNQNQRNITPAQMQQMKNLQAVQAQQMMQHNPMERQGSQMDMNGPRSGSPGSGDAPSPKRQRLEGNMHQQMQPGRPGPPGQMQGNQVGGPLPHDPALYAQTHELLRQRGIDPNQLSPEALHNLAMQPANHQAKSVEAYSASMKATMLNQANSNMTKGMPPNAAMGPGGAQGSPMSQTGIDGTTGEYYAVASGPRMAAMPNNAALAAAGQANNQGNHALQDYQMQLMLLEQQNKKRLLMARQEQDTMSHPPGVSGPNGPYASGLSPRANDPSPNPHDMQRDTPKINKAGMSPNSLDMAGRGSPQPSMMPGMVPPDLRQPMMQNGGQMMRPPSSHPMGAPMTHEQMVMVRQQGGMQQMPNGAWHMAQGPPQVQMMPGQPPVGPGQPQPPPNMTPRQGNQPMPPPPPPPQNATGTQPSSPAQAPAPPTPSQANKPKPGSKKAEQAKKAAAKKAGANNPNATPASEAEAPPTPTPHTPITPMHQNSFNHVQNKQLTNGGSQSGPPGPPGQPGPTQQPPPQAQAPPPDMGPAFGGMDSVDQFGGMNMDFGDLNGENVLDNFDFDSFLNTAETEGMAGFDPTFAFSGELEAGGDGLGNQ